MSTPPWVVPPWEKVILSPSERVTIVPYPLLAEQAGIFFLFPISRFQTAAIVAANLRLLLEEILIKKEQTWSNGEGEGVSDRALPPARQRVPDVTRFVPR